jgi:mono/diheme cytochrome c family protein
LRRAWILAFGLLAAAACGEREEIGLAEQGLRIYDANCTICHNPDPRSDGVDGPALAGSPRELIEARVMRAEYPPGYTPKRPTRRMRALPYLKPHIEALAAYLGGLEAESHSQ